MKGNKYQIKRHRGTPWIFPGTTIIYLVLIKTWGRFRITFWGAMPCMWRHSNYRVLNNGCVIKKNTRDSSCMEHNFYRHKDGTTAGDVWRLSRVEAIL